MLKPEIVFGLMNKYRIFAVLFILAMLLIFAGAAIGQENIIINEPDQAYKKGIELYQKKKPGAAQFFFRQIVKSNKEVASDLKVNATFYAALCGLELFNQNADAEMIAFINQYPYSEKTEKAYFELGRYYFQNKKYKNALPWYKKVDTYKLNKEELTEYYFKLGYSHFYLKDEKQAKQNFREIKDVESRYNSAATYYLSHIEYNEKNYNTALTGFNKLVKDETFGAIVPYYILQINYLKGNYDEVIERGPSLLDSSNTKRSLEINRIIAESYFKNKNYAEALPFFEKYKEKGGKFEREDYFQLGYCYQQAKQDQKAVENYKSAATGSDSLSQTAYYNMAVTYLNAGDKTFARNAFKMANKIDKDKVIAEDALFNYAKLCYELSNSPYDEAIAAFREYLRAYPEMNKSQEVQSYLLNVFLTTKNYLGAIKAIEEIKNPNLKFKEAYQQANYNYGVELFNKGNFKNASFYLGNSMKTDVNKGLSARSSYWLAECFYRLGDYKESADLYKDFIFQPGAAQLNYFETANYNIGYCFFKLQEYPAAITWFRKFIDLKPKGKEDENRLVDALVRTADCYFISKDFNNSSDFYARASALNSYNSDYAYYQNGVALGLLNKPNEKIKVLESLITNMPDSYFADDAKLEIGKTYQSQSESEKAIVWFRKLIKEHPNSPIVQKAMVFEGSELVNAGKENEALVVFKSIVDKYPKTEASFSALKGIENIYKTNGNINEYAAYIKGIDFADVSLSSLDSTSFEAAQNAYFEGDCEKAIKQLNSYMDGYPNGFFTATAKYYAAECSFKSGKLNEALELYNWIVEQPLNPNTERAITRCAEISMTQENFEKAEEYFVKIEGMDVNPIHIMNARINLMRFRNKKGDTEAAYNYAQKLLSSDGLQNNIKSEAGITVARFQAQTGNPEVEPLLIDLSKLMGLEIGAEAAYLLSNYYYSKGEFKKCEDEIFALGENYGEYDYWVAKGFILLADNYQQQGDVFQAKATLQSIIDNYEGEDLKKVAQDKLDKINAIERVLQEDVQEELPQEPIEIQL